MEKDDSLKKKMTKVKLNDGSNSNAKKGSSDSDDFINICSWNINGLRAVNGRGDLKNYLLGQNIDILCLNETKIDAVALDKLNDLTFIPKEYQQIWNCSKDKKGYSGVAIFSKIKPLSVVHDIGKSKHDREGRTLTIEYEKFYLVSCYVPNAGQKLEYFFS